MVDNKDELICPACGNVMNKIFIPRYGIMVDVCNEGCGGIWFDNREDLKFDEPHESIKELKEALKDAPNIEVEQYDVRYCPVCAVKMVKNFSSVNKKVEIDECYNCGGRFYDCGELEAVRKEYASEKERIADVVKSFYNDVINN